MKLNEKNIFEVVVKNFLVVVEGLMVGNGSFVEKVVMVFKEDK